jgi:hypothetical protein
MFEFHVFLAKKVKQGARVTKPPNKNLSRLTLDIKR